MRRERASNIDETFRTESIRVIVRVASRPKDAFAPDAGCHAAGVTPDEHQHMFRRDTGDYGTDEAHLKNTVCGGW